MQLAEQQLRADVELADELLLFGEQDIGRQSVRHEHRLPVVEAFPVRLVEGPVLARVLVLFGARHGRIDRHHDVPQRDLLGKRDRLVDGLDRFAGVTDHEEALGDDAQPVADVHHTLYRGRGDVLVDRPQDLFVGALDAEADVPTAIVPHVAEQVLVDRVDSRHATPGEFQTALPGQVEDFVDAGPPYREGVVHERDLPRPVLGRQELDFRHDAFSASHAELASEGRVFAERARVRAAAGRHDIGHRLVEAGFKSKITVGDDADHLTAVDHRQAGNALGAGDLEHLAHGHLRRDSDRILDHARFESLDRCNLRGLHFDIHILVDDADAALLGKRNRQARLGHGIHGSRQQR